MEARVRDILERGEQEVEPSARADAVQVAAYYASFMDETRADALDLQPIAPLIQSVRGAPSRDDLAEFMGTAKAKKPGRAICASP